MALTEPKLSDAWSDCSPTIRLSGIVQVEWGMGCTVQQPVNLYHCKIGNYVRLGPFIEIQNDAVVGEGTVISSHSFICAGCRIGRGVFVGHGVQTCNDRYPIANNREWFSEPPIIEDFASIGSGAIILPGVRIGERAIIGAGAVVTKNVPPGATIVGVH